MAKCEFKYFNFMNGIKYECPHTALEIPDYGEKKHCIFHREQSDKDLKEFSQGFNKLYEDDKHDFTGFIFPKSFDFTKLLGETADIVFNDASFIKATFLGDAYFLEAKFTGETNFERATFSNKVDFEEAKFLGETFFVNAKFSEWSNFMNATFSKMADFNSVKFIKESNFHRAKFEGETNFNGATFSGETQFNEVIFSSKTNFIHAKFLEKASFVWAKFLFNVSFRQATFTGEKGTNFSRAIFSGKGKVSFTKTKFSGQDTLDFSNAIFLCEGGADFTKAEFSGKGGIHFIDTKFIGEDGFSFRDAKFSGKGEIVFRGENFIDGNLADFRNISFVHSKEFRYFENMIFDKVNMRRCRLLRANLSEVKFSEVFWRKSRGLTRRNILFDETFQTGFFKRLLQKTGIFYKDKENDHYEVQTLYNQLRLNYENTGRYHEAGDFFVGAMEMRKKGTRESIITRLMLLLYKFISLYGERPVRAFFWILSTPFLFIPLYTLTGLKYRNSDRILKCNLSNIMEFFKTSNWGDIVNTFYFSLSNLALGKYLSVSFDTGLIPLNNLTNFVILLENICGLLFITLFILAMNRKFRRTKD